MLWCVEKSMHYRIRFSFTYEVFNVWVTCLRDSSLVSRCMEFLELSQWVLRHCWFPFLMIKMSVSVVWMNIYEFLRLDWILEICLDLGMDELSHFPWVKSPGIADWWSSDCHHFHHQLSSPSLIQGGEAAANGTLITVAFNRHFKLKKYLF